jgi:multiple sugar transport system permease protein
MFPVPLRTRSASARAGYAAAVGVALGVWLLPLAAIALVAAHSTADLNRGLVWTWPGAWSALDNFATVVTASRMGRFLWNSVVIAVPTVAATLVLSAMAGFALAKHDFPGNRLLLTVFVAGNLVPFQALMIPVRDLMLALGLYDTRFALILFHTAFQTGFCTLFLHNFLREIPDTVLDAARLDGARELTVFWKIALPLVRPALAAVAVLVFTFVWNDFFWATVLVQSDSARPLTAGLQSLRGMWQTAWNLVAAASLLAALPPVALFFVLQKQLLAGLSAPPRADP